MKRLVHYVIVLAVSFSFLAAPCQVSAYEADDCEYITLEECAEAIVLEYEKYGIDCHVNEPIESRLVERGVLLEAIESIRSNASGIGCCGQVVTAAYQNGSSVARVMPYQKIYTGNVGVTAVPLLAYGMINCVVEATVNAQNGQLMAVDNAYSYAVVGVNLSSWQQTSLSTGTIYRSGRQYVQAHLTGMAHFAWTEQNTGLSLTGSVPVDKTFEWPTE